MAEPLTRPSGPFIVRIVRSLSAGLALLVGLVLSIGWAMPSFTEAQTAPVPGAAALPSAAAPTGTPSLRDISHRMDRLFTSEASIGRMELTVVSPRRTRTMRMRMWTRGQDRALIVIESPSRERGTATLRVERNLWNYLPRISRTIRVPPAMMLSSWMGSDFTNDDLTHSNSYETDFTGRVVGHTPDGRGWLIRYEAREGAVGLWRRVELYMDAAGELPTEARYYDRRLRHARTMRFEEVQEMDGRRIPTRLVLVPIDRPGNRTEIRYLEMDFDANVPSSTFSLTQLERRR